MSKALTITLAVLIAVAFASSGFAAMSEKSVKITGQVMKNDGKEMVVKTPSGEETFEVTGVKNVNKYRPGDDVNISYTEKDGRMTASSISKPLMHGKMKEETKESAERSTR